jgi:hypothetical protein
MFSIKTTFTKAAFGTPGSDTFWLLIWVIFILDDIRRDDEKRRKKRERAAALVSMPKPSAGPCPF